MMKQEGCPNSENLFSDTDKAIELDDVQRRISQKHHADKKSSADMLLHVNDKRLLLADAKFRLSNTRNLDSKEIAKKVSESKAMVTSNYSFDNSFYVTKSNQGIIGTSPQIIRIIIKFLLEISFSD